MQLNAYIYIHSALRPLSIASFHSLLSGNITHIYICGLDDSERPMDYEFSLLPKVFPLIKVTVKDMTKREKVAIKVLQI